MKETKLYQCKNHHSEISYHPDFCAKCGKPLSECIKCPNCGNYLYFDFLFCRKCGTKRPDIKE